MPDPCQMLISESVMLTSGVPMALPTEACTRLGMVLSLLAQHVSETSAAPRSASAAQLLSSATPTLVRYDSICRTFKGPSLSGTPPSRTTQLYAMVDAEPGADDSASPEIRVSLAGEVEDIADFYRGTLPKYMPHQCWETRPASMVCWQR